MAWGDPDRPINPKISEFPELKEIVAGSILTAEVRGALVWAVV